MGWIVAAQGTSFSDLKETIQDMELPKGTKMKVVMDLKVPVGGSFNWAVSDWLAEKFVPDGMEFIDAYGEGSQGTIEMESDPAFLLAILAFIKAHWFALVIAGFLLWFIISLINVLINLPEVLRIPTLILVGIGIAAVGFLYLSTRKRKWIGN